MRNSVRVTYTLPKEIIPHLLVLSVVLEKSLSKIIRLSLEEGFEIMEESLRLNEDLSSIPKKRRNTITKTFTIPIEVSERLSYYSEKLGLKKSHLVYSSLVYFYQRWKG
jgi:predicted DNA-binding protein